MMLLNGALPAASTTATSATAANTKPRSCVVCRSRKVRCDKLSPCSNCRRANIECVVPSNDRPPRWARRLERLSAATTGATTSASPSSTSSLLQPSLPTTRAPHAQPPSAAPETTQVMERLRNLESLVKELSDQLGQTHSAAGGSSRPSSSPAEQHVASSTTVVHEDMGRLVLGDTDRPHYIASGFWSRISDELDGLKMDTQRLDAVESDSSDDEDASPGKTPSLPEVHRTSSDRYSFLFGHNLMGPAPALSEFRPLPSQIPFLLDTFSTNVNFFLQVVHMPTVNKIVRNMREDDMAGPSSSNEALLSSIYYAAVTSMVDEDVTMNFGSPKAELSLKYRLGLERALAKADFMRNPDIVLVQALTIFVFLARSHDSPRFVWMMTGLVIRMAHAIGLQRDGSHFAHLTPFEAEMRRRVWWAVCMLDTRASEDQGTDYTITVGTYDTELPRNINDADIGPETAELPQECEGLTDMSVALVTHEMCSKARLMSGPEAIPTAASLEAQDRALTTFAANLERLYLRYAADSGSVVGWVAAIGARLVIRKHILYTYFPVLAGPAGKTISEKLRDRLLVAALELAEYNHALHSEHKARHWRWLFQSYTHWHAIVYLLIECSRRPWSPILERVWIALHGPWLIPRRPSAGVDRKSQIWVPLRQLMSKARRHRREELRRQRGDAKAIEQREAADRRNIAVPASPGPFPEGKCEEMLLEHWRSLVHVSVGPGPGESGTSNSSSVGGSIPTPPPPNSAPNQPWSKASSGSKSPDGPSHVTEQGLFDIFGYLNPTVAPGDSQGASATGPAASPEWLWADADPAVDVCGGVEVDMNMDVGADVDWNSWVQSAADMEINARSAGQTAGGFGTERGGW